MKLTVLSLLITCAIFAAAQQRLKSICKIAHLSDRVVAVSCLNGGDPTVAGNTGGALIVSCGN